MSSGCLISHMKSHWRRHLPYLLLLLISTAFLIVSSLLHHHALGTGYDLGIYDQVIWNLSHGRIWETTLVYETGGYYDHFEPILVLLTPLYWLWPNVQVLLVVQAIALALGSLPIYLYAYVRFVNLVPANRSMAIALALAAIYLAFPAMHHANLNDFHEVALLPPLVGFALYGLLRGRPRVLFIFLALCLIVKEDFGVTAMAISLYIILFKPKGFTRRQGVVLGALVLIWVWLVLNVFYPGLTRGMSYPFVERRYAWLAATPQGALKVVLTKPWVLIPPLTEPPKLMFLIRLFGPLLFLPLLGWPVIGLAFPILIYLMLSTYQPQWSIQSYYNPPLLPFLFFGLIEALHGLYRLASRHRGRASARRVLAALIAAVAVAVGIAYYLDAPGPGSRVFNPESFRVTPRVLAANEIMAHVPADASLSTEWPLISHLSHRRQIYTMLARPATPPAYLLTEPKPGAEGAPGFPFAAPDGWPPVYHEYDPVASVGPFQLQSLQRSIPMTLLPAVQPRPTPLNLAGYAWLGGDAEGGLSPSVAPAQVARLLLAWQRTGKLDRRYVFFVHLLDPVRKQADGTPAIVTQSGHEGGDGSYPTIYWESWTAPGVVLDEQRLEIPSETPPGTYGVWAGVYDKETGQRVELGGPGQTLVHVDDLVVQLVQE